ncbi:fluoride efflux transporter CrcB [Candidatus Berkiella aquae]|uniref:Fluoride-specific ion channel FluC n=1 Tax=Candidatus Berkiella aquae TaxID=295108 RepID=A0A0Q9YPI0_9GAMM|nr:fluoride efflux transporter CrcB [Candidatus Berkiella aquae]MCS5711937.1 fluoride efflux transporter CrcB [Candidatus Berkiella aquae]
MNNLILIFIGAGVGGVLRYWLSSRIQLFLGSPFPYGTLFVNVSGSFLMGFLFVFIMERFTGLGPQLRALLLIGLLGGYTTFSSFSIETLQLVENGQWVGALTNIVLSILLCITATWIGIIGARVL